MPRRERDPRRDQRRDDWDDDRWQPQRRAPRRGKDPRSAGREHRRPAQPDLSVPPLMRTPEPVILPLVCGSCREWFAHDTGGRGSCDHPGSGFFAPWSDTAACQFFNPRR